MSAKRPDTLFDELAALGKSKSPPPVGSWHPARSGSIDIRIDRDGVWLHEGEPIRRAPMVRLFSTILRKDPDGYCLVTPAERLLITVDEVPFLAVELAISGAGPDTQLLFRTNVDDVVSVDAEHPLWVEDAGGDPRPYVRVRDALDARLTRPVFYQLVEAADWVDGECGIHSGGKRFSLGHA